jgi:hypothetical protein
MFHVLAQFRLQGGRPGSVLGQGFGHRHWATAGQGLAVRTLIPKLSHLGVLDSGPWGCPNFLVSIGIIRTRRPAPDLQKTAPHSDVQGFWGGSVTPRAQHAQLGLQGARPTSD